LGKNKVLLKTPTPMLYGFGHKWLLVFDDYEVGSFLCVFVVCVVVVLFVLLLFCLCFGLVFVFGLFLGCFGLWGVGGCLGFM
jgi:hypothetical protein